MSILKKTPHGTEGRHKVQGSVDPMFAAGLPFPVPEILEFKACRAIREKSRNSPGIFPQLSCRTSRAAKRGGFQTGGFSDLDLSFLFCPFLGLSRFFWDFPDLLGDSPGISRFVLILFLGLLRAPTRNSPKRVRDTIWTFPEKSGKHPGLETPRFSFSQELPRRPQKEPQPSRVF